MTSLKEKTVKGIVWSSIERFSAQAVQFILGIILARLLLPADYGLMGMLIVFLAISRTFIDSGFSKALVQKKNRDEKDFSTVFYFNIVVAIVFYLLLFVSAPLIAVFFKQAELISLTRVIGLTLIINSLAVVPQAKFTINIDFKTQTKASLFSIIISGLVGIYLAFSGYGVWALVYLALIRAVLNVSVLWFYSKWLPRDGFHYHRFKKLFSFGSKLLFSSLIETVYNNIYLIVIGKVFSAGELGYYTRARQFNNFPSSNISDIILRVTFPVLSELQDDDKKLTDAFSKFLKYSTLLVFPLMIGLASLAEPLIRVLLTEKWIESAWILQILCFAGMWYPIGALNLTILNVKGRSDLYLRVEIIKKIIVTIVLIISVPFGIKVIILGRVVTTYIAFAFNAHYTKMVIGYGFMRQIKDLYIMLFLSLAMGLLIFFTIRFIQADVLKLVVGILEGFSFYIGIAWLFNIGEIKALPSVVKLK